MGLWSRIQVGGALQRLGKRIAANPYLWQMAADERPHFDHWVEEHASDGDLERALSELVAFLSEIPPRYRERDWGQEIATIVQGSIECVKREKRKRGLESPGADTTKANPDEARRPIFDLFDSALKRQLAKFAGRINSETDARSVRLTALIDATFELYKTQVPGMDAALNDVSNRRNVAQKLTAEYMPFLMLDPAELRRAFVEYILWKFGDTEAAEHLVDVDYLKSALQRAISLLPEEGRLATLSSKQHFEWGKLL